MDEYIKYINLTIADSSINSFAQYGGSFTSFNTFANYIRQRLILKDITSISVMIMPIIEDIKYIYGVGIIEASDLVVKYFMESSWETYYEPTNNIRKYFGKFLVA